MDQEILVKGGHALVKAMDAAGIAPRVAMWVHNTDTDSWKLWIVPPRTMTDKREFYRRIAELISKNQAELAGIDVSETEMVAESHPAMQGIGRFIRAPGLTTVHFTGNRFNGFYLPDGIILRS